MRLRTFFRWKVASRALLRSPSTVGKDVHGWQRRPRLAKASKVEASTDVNDAEVKEKQWAGSWKGGDWLENVRPVDK